MKKTLIALSLVMVLASPLAVRAQTATTTPAMAITSGNCIELYPADLPGQYQCFLVKLIDLLMQRVAELQAQLAVMQTQQNEIKNAVIPPPIQGGGSVSVPANPGVGVALPEDEYPVIKFFVDKAQTENTDVATGTHAIEWLATQKNGHDLACSSPEMGKMGSQGITVRELASTTAITMTCTDQTTLQQTVKTLTLRILQP